MLESVEISAVEAFGDETVQVHHSQEFLADRFDQGDDHLRVAAGIASDVAGEFVDIVHDKRFTLLSHCAADPSPDVDPDASGFSHEGTQNQL